MTEQYRKALTMVSTFESLEAELVHLTTEKEKLEKILQPLLTKQREIESKLYCLPTRLNKMGPSYYRAKEIITQTRNAEKDREELILYALKCYEYLNKNMTTDMVLSKFEGSYDYDDEMNLLIDFINDNVNNIIDENYNIDLPSFSELKTSYSYETIVAVTHLHIICNFPSFTFTLNSNYGTHYWGIWQNNVPESLGYNGLMDDIPEENSYGCEKNPFYKVYINNNEVDDTDYIDDCLAMDNKYGINVELESNVNEEDRNFMYICRADSQYVYA